MHLKQLVRKWYFWVFLVFAIPAIWWVWGWVVFQLDRQDMLAENRSAYLGWLKMESDQKLVEARWKADTYGGETPEETLRLFRDALIGGDYELASKYYIPEIQSEQLEDIKASVKNGFLDEYISVIQFENKVSFSDDRTAADVDFYDGTGAQVHFAQMILNPYTKRWKFESI